MVSNPDTGDDDILLKIYNRRLGIADNKFKEGEADRRRFVARYRNEVEDDQVTEEGHRVSVTTGTGIIDTMYSSMTAVDVEFLANNTGHGTALQALAATRALNQAWKDTKGSSRVKGAVKDACLVDIGWAKVYYDYVSEVVLSEVPEEAIKAQIDQIRNDSGMMPDQPLTAAQRDSVKAVAEVEVVLRDRVCIEYVPWDMIRADPSAKRIEDVRWVCQYTHMPVYEVRSHPTWSAFVTEKYGDVRGRELLDSIKGDTSIDKYTDSAWFTSEIEKDEHMDDARVTICEMWDLETGLTTVFAKNRKDVILHQRVNPLMMNVDFEDRSPFKALIIRKDNSQLEGLGDMRIIWPALNELDEYRTNLATYIERTIPKILGPEENMTQKGKDALKSTVWGEFIGLQGGDANQFSVIQPPALPQEALQLPDRIQEEMKEGTGVSEPMRGIFPSKRTTATETQIVTDRGDQRQSERRSALEDWYISIARCMLQLMEVHYDKDRMLRYTDDLGQEFEWAFNSMDISMDADIEVSITPKENLTRDQRIQRFLLLMNLALPLPEADRGEFIRQAGLEMGFRGDTLKRLVKTQEEVDLEKQQAQADQLAVKPQPFANSPQGMSIG